jgi:gamma-carbonic anhydrase
MLMLPWEGRLPQIARDAFIAPNATLIGDVSIGAGSSVWFGCVLRGDEEPIHIGPGTNIQDLTLIHTSGGLSPTIIGAHVTVGHSAVIHGCTIHDGALIGMGAIVLDEAVVESGALVAAGAVVSPGKVVKAGELWAGCPAKYVGPVTDRHREMARSIPGRYQAKAAAYRAIKLPDDAGL